MRRSILLGLFVVLLWALSVTAPAQGARVDPILGLVSDSAKGTHRYLVIALDFPDVKPRVPLEQIRQKAQYGVERWYQAASYGQTRFSASFKGPYTLPDNLSQYRVSPYNYEVSSEKVYKLVRDALSLVEEDGISLKEIDVVALILRAFTLPGQGYGMMCYCANPGMLSKVRGGRAKYDPVTTRRGTVFAKGLVVMVENFHFGFLVHDLAHAIAGVHQGVRLVGDLYDFDLQSKPRSKFAVHDAAVHLGPWDLMSQHFVDPKGPPPGFSLFTRIRLGYVRPNQVALVNPGQTGLVRLSPLAAGGDNLGIKIPLSSSRYLLVENRQAIRLDRSLPSSGVMIYEVDETLEEGGGLVKAKNADPQALDFSRAPFGTDGQARIAYVQDGADLAIVPLAKLDTDYLVLIAPAKQLEPARAVAQGLARSRGAPDYQQKVKQTAELVRQGRLVEAARQF